MEDGIKICPFCKEKIRKEAVKCRFCGEWLEESSRPKSEPNQKHEDSIPTALIESGPTSTTQSADSTTTPTAQEAATSKPNAAQVEPTKDFRSNRPIKENPFIPLFLIVLWISWFVLPQAIAHGTSSIPNLIYITLLYCISPITIIVLLLLGNWLWGVRRNFRSSRPSSQVLKRTLPEKAKIIAIIALFLISSFFTYKKNHLASQQRAASDRQELQAKGINLDAFKNWEFTKQETKIGNGTAGLAPELKKRMREMFAMQFKGLLTSQPGLTVELNGDDHDELVVSFNGTMDPAIAEKLPDAIQQADADFWNRMRYLDFKALIFTGTNYSESITQAQFIQWSHGYETFVSNMASMYDAPSNQSQFFESKEGDVNPDMKRQMRQGLATMLQGSMKSIYGSFDVKLEGTNDNILVFSCKDIDANNFNDFLKPLQQDKSGNFFNAMRAMGFSELILAGDSFRKSIPQAEFVQWCRDYDKYLTEFHKIVGQMSEAMKHEPTAPQSPP